MFHEYFFLCKSIQAFAHPGIESALKNNRSCNQYSIVALFLTNKADKEGFTSDIDVVQFGTDRVDGIRHL